jgi:hypothetical protein
MRLLQSNTVLNVLLLLEFIHSKRLDELVALLEDGVREVSFLLGLLGFGLRLQSRLKNYFHVGPRFFN